MPIKTIELNKHKVFLLRVIRGLVSESMRVRNTYHDIKPDAIAISISSEELEGLKKFLGEKEEKNETNLSNYEEEIYTKWLRAYGKVRKPPPCFEEALQLSKKTQKPIIPIDMNDEKFSDAYCRYVTGLQLVRYSLRKKRLGKKRFRAKTPEEFVLEWDKTLNSLKGFRRIEEERERHMARELRSLCRDYKKILAIIELERAVNVEKILSKT